MAVDAIGNWYGSPRAPDGLQAPPLPTARPVALPHRGTTLVYDSEGPSGAPTLILLHGLGATAALNWFTSFPMLTDRYRVVALDHRGHGLGIRASSPFTLEAVADDVVALADVLAIEHFVPIGYSMGGPIAQLLWRRHPRRVSGLVLCATGCRFRETPLERAMFAALPAVARVQQIVPDAVARRVIAQLARVYLAESPYADWARRELLLRDPRAVLQAAGELGRYRAERWIGDIRVPTTVLVHLRDQLVPLHRQLELASAIPGAVTRYVDADHFAVVRAPEQFVPVLARAVRDVTRPLASPTEARRRAS